MLFRNDEENISRNRRIEFFLIFCEWVRILEEYIYKDFGVIKNVIGISLCIIGLWVKDRNFNVKKENVW